MNPINLKMEEEANLTLLEYIKKFNQKLIPPIPVKSIAERLYGFKVLEGKLQRENDAKLFIKDKVILLNAIYPLTRRRFSISHEIYHIKSHQTLHKHNHRHKDNDWVEKQANIFAAYLLLPRGLVYEYIVREIQSVDGNEHLNWVLRLIKISEDFSVASARRLSNSINQALLSFLPEQSKNPINRIKLFASIITNLANKFEVSREAFIYQLRNLGLACRFTSFKPNEKAPISGCYWIIWPSGEVASKKVILNKGQVFPLLPREGQRYVIEELILT